MASLKRKLLAALGRKGQIAFTTPGTYEWTPPPGLRRLSFVLVGGPSRNGAGLSWFNDVPTSGNPITIVVASGSPSGGITRVTIDGHTYEANGQTGGGVHSSGAPFSAKGGANGGNGLTSGTAANSIGGGAAGYSGNGGNASAAAPPGGGGGGGSTGRGGGGVGLMGEGPSGDVGMGGSGGAASTGRGGQFGGGTGGSTSNNGFATGAVRFIWGPNRRFPSTRTGDL